MLCQKDCSFVYQIGPGIKRNIRCLFPVYTSRYSVGFINSFENATIWERVNPVSHLHLKIATLKKLLLSKDCFTPKYLTGTVALSTMQLIKGRVLPRIKSSLEVLGGETGLRATVCWLLYKSDRNRKILNIWRSSKGLNIMGVEENVAQDLILSEKSYFVSPLFETDQSQHPNNWMYVGVSIDVFGCLEFPIVQKAL